MFNDKMLLPPALDEGMGGCVDLEGGWLVMTPSPLEFDDIVGKSVADGLIGGSMDGLGGTIVGEPIRGSSVELVGNGRMEIGGSAADELVGNGNGKKNGGSVSDELVGDGKRFGNGESVADELDDDRRSDKIGFKSGESVVDELDGDRRSDKSGFKSGGSALVDGRGLLF